MSKDFFGIKVGLFAILTFSSRTETTIANWCLFVFPIFMFELFWIGVTILQPKLKKKKKPTKPNEIHLVGHIFIKHQMTIESLTKL